MDIQSLKNKIEFNTIPPYIIMFPIFYIINIYNQFSGTITPKELALPALLLLCISFGFYLISNLIIKEKKKSGILALFTTLYFMFFGNLKHFLSGIPILKATAQYKLFIPLSCLFFLILYYLLKKKNVNSESQKYLNTLFSLLLAIEFFKLVFPNNNLIQNNYSTINTTNISTNGGTHPDIYYLVIDGYPSSVFQKEVLNQSPNFLDTALTTRGFHTLSKPVSNYQFTSFSIAATLQLDYLKWIKSNKSATPHDYLLTTQTINNSFLIKWLIEEEYKIFNLSIFDLQNSHSIEKGRFHSIPPSDIVFYNSFWSKLKWEIIPAIFTLYRNHLVRIQFIRNQSLRSNYDNYNNLIIDSLKKIPDFKKDKHPKFVYAHLEMPHFPYFYDSLGVRQSDEVTFSPSSSLDKKKFGAYIAYTNKVVINLVDSILKPINNDKNIIIIQSDHGNSNFRESVKEDAFRNYSAFYFPDKDYSLLYDSMSNVNTFRIILNKYFGQQLPLLKDSSIYLKF